MLRKMFRSLQQGQRLYIFKVFVEYPLNLASLEHTQLTATVLQRAAMQQLSAKIFKLSFEYLHIYSPKSGDFCKNSKVASLWSR